MSKVRSAWKRVTGWFKGDGRPDGGGPGGGPNSDSYNRARAEGEFARFRDTGAGGFS